MQKFACLISYDGTSYCGWQRQPVADSKRLSIQEVIENAIEQLTQEKRVVVGSGRTDAGVHALGQVMHFNVSRKKWSSFQIQNGLNSLLPPTIRILSAQEVPSSFHAQRSAERKQYSYYLQQGPAVPHWRHQSWWIRKTLNLDAMRESANHLVGEHDFRGFCAAGSNVKTTIREIFEADVTWVESAFPRSLTGIPKLGLIRIRVLGSGFLKQMIRGIAGTLVQVGEGRMKPEIIREILLTGKRSLLGRTAPSRGLWLEEVFYPDLNWLTASDKVD